MGLAFTLFLLIYVGEFNDANAQKELGSGPQLNRPYGDCSYAPSTNEDAASKVKDVVRRFNAAIICKDLKTAQLFVDESGTVEEVEEYIGDDGRPVKRVGSGSWPEQLFLFTRPDPEHSTSAQETVVQGEPVIIVDGSSALVRQTLWSQVSGNPPASACLVEHLMLVKVGSDWKIRNMMLVDAADGCTDVARQP